MAQCAGYKRDGSQCTATVEPPQRYCWWHDPANANQRRRAASKAARSKPNGEIRDIKSLCKEITDRVLSGELLPGPAAVVNQFLNTQLRAIEQERKQRELEEVLERIERLERLQQTSGGKRWG
jgi:hypothetical protein